MTPTSDEQLNVQRRTAMGLLLMDSAAVEYLLQIALGLCLFEDFNNYVRDLQLFFGSGCVGCQCMSTWIYRVATRQAFSVLQRLEAFFPLRGRWLQILVAVMIGI